MLKINFKKVKDFFKQLPRALAEHSFLTFLVFFIFSLIVGGLVFYQYGILAKSAEQSKGKENIFTFDQDAYQKILNEWKSRNEMLSGVGLKVYSDPFKAVATSTPKLTK